MAETPKKEESKVEGVKRASRHLRGTIAETLAADSTHFHESDEVLLKFHGTYQQDDRDVRQDRRKQGLEEAYQFMVRVAIPSGVVTADQYVQLDELADRYANHSLRVTTRQGIQYHGVLKKGLKKTIAGINQSLLTTLAACGDVERNVMGCPAPLGDSAHTTVQRLTKEIARELRPATKAYHEIWLNGEKHLSTETESETEPFYKDTYLPRKFKTGVALATDNCIDVYSYDLALVAIFEGDNVVGYNVLVGGGMGMTHGKADTFARLAEPLAYVEAEHVIETARTVAAIYRDHGNRADRRHSRIKYLIAEWGMEKFREEFRQRVSFTPQPFRSIPTPPVHDHLGLHPQADGKWFLGVFVESGRIIDRPECQMKTALRSIVEKYRTGVHFTASQNVLLTGLNRSDVDAVQRVLKDHGVRLVEELSLARRFSMACPALPTCGLAMADSERLMPAVVDRFEAELTSLGLRDEPISLRMTGCPNGCARPYTADIAFVGRRPDVYHIYVGGGIPGDRVVDLYAADVATQDMVTVMRPLLSSWASNRRNSESLSDYYQRLLNRTESRQLITGKEEPTQRLIQLGIAS
ncbi:MAG: NADPH-dependent assimilatory sulfite reductase hemoprotein subunit [Planctomycetota bacterium]